MKKVFGMLIVLSTLFFTNPAQAADKAPVTHKGRGEIKAIKDGGKVLVIDHEAIPDYMDAMTMPFELSDTLLAKHFKVGDYVAFTITQKGDFWPITALKKVKKHKTEAKAKMTASKTEVRPEATMEPMKGMKMDMK